MMRCWLPSVVLIAVALLAGAELSAQRSGLIPNMNTHAGKYDSGGFSAGLLLGIPLSGDLYRDDGFPGASGIAGADIETDSDTSAFGLTLAYQFGSDNDTIGTVASADIVSYSYEALGVDFDVTAIRFGFDFVINFKKSEFIEEGGRRRRRGWNFSAILGVKGTLLVGDLDDINGIATVGVEAGLGADIPLNNIFGGINGDDWQLMPQVWFELNYHTSGDAQGDLFTSTQSGGPNSTSADGLVVRSSTIVPPFTFNIGTDLVYTPLFEGEEGNLINNWRFSFGVYLNVPVAVNSFQADDPGDPLFTDSDKHAFLTLTLGVGYYW